MNGFDMLALAWRPRVTSALKWPVQRSVVDLGASILEQPLECGRSTDDGFHAVFGES
jgi:hypothetical protein